MSSRGQFGTNVLTAVVDSLMADQERRGLSQLEGMREVLTMATGKPVTLVDA
jgi:hypothetical protein